MEVKHLSMPFKLKSVSDTGEFEGYGSVFGIEDSYRDVVEKGAFEKSLSLWAQKGDLPALLWQHKMSEPIGVYTEMKEDDHGLYVKGRLLIDDDPLAKRAHAHMKVGSIKGLSIGYILKDWEYDSAKNVYRLKEIDLWEVSVVTFPANTEAKISEVKSMLQNGETPSLAMIERALKEAFGFSSTQARAFIAKGYEALDPKSVDTGSDLLQPLKDLGSIFKGK